MPETEIATVQQAFDAAKAQHAPATEVSPAVASPAQPDEATAAPPDTKTAPPEPTDLLSDEEYAALERTHANDPAKLAKELKAVFTKKTQALAEQRKSLEPLQRFQEAYLADPTATITDLATRHGLTIAPTPQETQVTTTAATIAEVMAARVKTELGPDLDFLAEPLTRAFRTMAEEVAKSVAEQTVKPLKEQQDQFLTRAAVEQTATVMQTFEKSHPDWKKHEPALVALSRQLQPNGMTELDYLDLLYAHITRDQQIADATRKALERMTQAAETAEGREHPPSDSRITVTSTAPQTIREAYVMAKRGERVE